MSAFPAPNRPRTVTLTLWGVFLLGVWNGGRVVALARQSSLLLSLAVKPNPIFRLVVALIWTILFLGSVIALRQKRPFTRRAIPILLTTYALYELSLVAIYARATPARQGWTLNALFYTGAILFSHWALNRSAVGAYFNKGESED